LEKYLALKKLSNPKTVLNELSNVKTLYTIKLLIYKNGEGRLKPGELIFGTSIQGVSVKYCYYILKIIGFLQFIFCFFKVIKSSYRQTSAEISSSTILYTRWYFNT
jgi:hypothetical protein